MNSKQRYITIMEDWVEREGKVYYLWKTPEETEWHEKLTPYTQKPYFTFKYLTKPEFDKLKEVGDE